MTRSKLPPLPKKKRSTAFREVPLSLLDGSSALATAIGNNAAWLCSCERELPLIASLRVAREVRCPGCGKRYRVVANSAKQASKVEEFA